MAARQRPAHGGPAPVYNVSLLVPCYRAGRYLPGLFASVARSGWPFAEVICADDASNDDTAAVARSFLAQAPSHVRTDVLELSHNGGPSRCRNRLLAVARCPWVHFHDADDVIEPELVPHMMAASERADVVICHARWQQRDTGELVRLWTFDDRIHQRPTAYTLRHPVPINNGFFRRSKLSAIGGFREDWRIWEDSDVYVRLAYLGATFAVVPQVLTVSLRGPGGVSSDDREVWRARVRVLRDYAGWMPAELRDDLLAELDLAADQLVALGDLEHAVAAIDLGRSIGGDLPLSNNVLIHTLRRFAGPLAALRTRQWIRRKLRIGLRLTGTERPRPANIGT